MLRLRSFIARSCTIEGGGKEEMFMSHQNQEAGEKVPTGSLSQDREPLKRDQ